MPDSNFWDRKHVRSIDPDSTDSFSYCTASAWIHSLKLGYFPSHLALAFSSVWLICHAGDWLLLCVQVCNCNLGLCSCCRSNNQQYPSILLTQFVLNLGTSSNKLQKSSFRTFSVNRGVSFFVKCPTRGDIMTSIFFVRCHNKDAEIKHLPAVLEF